MAALSGAGSLVVGTSRAGRPVRSIGRRIDAPNRLALNRRPSTLAALAGLLTLGTSLRAEASLLATTIRRARRQTNARGASAIDSLPVFNFGPFASQRLTATTHVGTSLRTLASRVEGRTTTARALSLRLGPTAVLLGIETLRSGTGNSITIATLPGALVEAAESVSRRLRTATPTGDRFGAIHASSATLAAAVLGLTAPRAAVSFAKDSHAFSVAHVTGQSTLRSTTAVTSGSALAIHAPRPNTQGALATPAFSSLRPLTSLYEQTGHLLSLVGGNGGVIRRHQRSSTPPVNSRSVEGVRSALARRSGAST